MKAFHSDRLVLPLPPGHRFPRSKYRLLRQKVEGLADLDLEEAESIGDADLEHVHDAAYVRAVANGTLSPAEQRAIGFPWSEEMVERSRRSVGATVGAARSALVEGVAANLAGGTHHAAVARGSGYCVFNDVAVATRLLQAEAPLRLGLRRRRQRIHDLAARRQQLSVSQGA
jgi:acetoin utilization deacetylase AcuC-like enzyme